MANVCHYCTEDSGGYMRMFGAYYIFDNTLRTGHCEPQTINFCPMCGRNLNSKETTEHES